MLRNYELFYILRPDLDEEQMRAAMDEVAGLVDGQGGEVTKSSLWGRRRLAYTVAGFSDGYYVLKEISLPAEKVRELERQLILDERVIRQLVSLRQVYYLPEGEDRRGRVRSRGRDRARAPKDGEDGAPVDEEEADETEQERVEELDSDESGKDGEEAVVPEAAADEADVAEPPAVVAEATEE